MVAPKKESTKLPVSPAIEIAANKNQSDEVLFRKASGSINTPGIAINSAATNAASDPNSDTPPDVPRSITFPETMWIGGFMLSTPISVAQVSAFTAAIEPQKASHGQI